MTFRRCGRTFLKGVDQAGAFHRLLGDAVVDVRLRNASGFQDGGGDVDHMAKLGPQTTLLLNFGGPGNHHAVANAAQVGGHLLRPLEGAIHGPGPTHGIVGGGFGTAPNVVAAAIVLHG